MRSILVLLGLATLVAVLCLCLPSARPSAPVSTDNESHAIAASDARAAAPLDAVEETSRTQEPAVVESVPEPVIRGVPDPVLPQADVTVRVLCPDGEVCRNVRVFCETCVEADRPSYWPMKLERETDADGCARFSLAELGRGRWILVRATGEPELASPERVFTGRVPAEVTITLQRAHALRVLTRDDAGRELSQADVTVAKELGGMLLLRERSKAGDRGNVDFELPAGRYEVRARAAGSYAKARETVELYGERTVVLTLAEEKLPLAVSGTVVDEAGRPIAGVSVRASATEPSADVQWGQGYTFSVDENGASVTAPARPTAFTDANGAFEIRMAASEHVHVRIESEPLFAAFEPSPARVAYGTKDLVLRRTHAFRTTKLRVHVVDAASKKPVRTATLALKVTAEERWQVRAPCRGGWADAVVPERADATWRIEAPGYFAVENTALDLVSRARGGVVELALVRDAAAPLDAGEGSLQFRGPR